MMRDQRGQSMVEFALLLPIFIALIFGALSMIMAFQAKVVVTDAARNAGRLSAIICDQQGDWYEQVKATVQADLSGGALAVRAFAPFVGEPQPGQWYVEASCDGSGGFTSVTVHYAQINLFPPLMWFLGERGPGASSFVFPLHVGVVYPVE